MEIVKKVNDHGVMFRAHHKELPLKAAVETAANANRLFVAQSTENDIVSVETDLLREKVPGSV